MGYIILCSKNPKTSYVIKKNPATAPHIKRIRKGFCIGWFNTTSNEEEISKTKDELPTKVESHAKEDIKVSVDADHQTTYVMRFLDCGENVSFPKNQEDEYDYLPYPQYCSPMLLSVVIKDMLDTALNKGDIEDTPNECSIEQAVIKINQKCFRIVNKLNSFIPKFKIEHNKTNIGGLYKIIIKSEKSTISDLLQYSYLVGYILNSMTFSYTDKPIASSLDKIIRIMNNLSVPYYIRYMLKTTMIGHKEFFRVRKELEGGKGAHKEKITMMFGNTQYQRFTFISDNVLKFLREKVKSKGTIHIVDIGCGEGYYVRELLFCLKKNGIEVVYHAHDIDSSEMDKVESLVASDDLYSCVVTYKDIDSLISSISSATKQKIVEKNLESKDVESKDTVLVIFSEVIEHIPIKEVKKFMAKILSLIDFDLMLITTPREEFNINYLLEKGEFRHNDHKQEFTKEEFIALIESLKHDEYVSHKNLKLTFKDVGDIVDGIGMAQAIILEK
jgi:2-polyprenyl-3-methyl-5-hydroxy-6-metoxy-1,4-benzoquinol methylase